VGSVTHGYRLRHLYGHLHSLLRCPHSLFKPQFTKESQLWGNFAETSAFVTAKGKKIVNKNLFKDLFFVLSFLYHKDNYLKLNLGLFLKGFLFKK